MHHLVRVRTDKAGHSIRDDLRHRSALQPDYWGAAGKGLRHDNAERFIPKNGHQKGSRTAKQRIFLNIINCTDVRDGNTIDVRSYLTSKIFLVLGRYVSSDHEGHP